jgi:HEAT repeat protein
VEVLGTLVDSDPQVRQALIERLADDSYDVRQAAVEALGALVDSDPQVRQALIERLADDSYDVRLAAVNEFLPLLTSDPYFRQALVPWLGTILEKYIRLERGDGKHIRRRLAEQYAPLLANDSAIYAQVVALLDSPSWPARQGATWALISMPGGPPPSLMPKLLRLLDDLRGEESWPERLQVAEMLINDCDRDLSQRAIETALTALDYATQPWYYLPTEGRKVRQQAAQILGQLEPLYRDERIFARLTRVMEEDQSEIVRDAAYNALLRLAAAPEQTGTAP